MFQRKNQDVEEKEKQHSLPESTQNIDDSEGKTVDELKAENDALFGKLTNKNSEYMVKLNRKLTEYELSEENKVRIYHQMLPVIVEQQANHLTARKLYGTVTDQARLLAGQAKDIEENKEGEPSETWKIYLDGALTLGGFFAIINGLGGIFTEDMAGMSLINLVLNFLLGGLAMMVLTKYAPVPGQKGGFLKYLGATTGVMLLWMIVMIGGGQLLNVFIPPVINPYFRPEVLAVVGGVAIALKFYLKKKLNIVGTLF